MLVLQAVPYPPYTSMPPPVHSFKKKKKQHLLVLVVGKQRGSKLPSHWFIPADEQVELGHTKLKLGARNAINPGLAALWLSHSLVPPRRLGAGIQTGVGTWAWHNDRGCGCLNYEANCLPLFSTLLMSVSECQGENANGTSLPERELRVNSGPRGLFVKS